VSLAKLIPANYYNKLDIKAFCCSVQITIVVKDKHCYNCQRKRKYRPKTEMMTMFKVKCTMISFRGDEQKYPCHFNYKIGDEFYYNGVNFTGRICPGLLASMMPVVHGVYLLGNKYSENIMYRYRGHDTRDPAMTKYDGVGFRPIAATIEPDSDVTKIKVGHFLCSDDRTLAHFSCEPVDISDSDYAQPFYRREIAILEKVEQEPGIKTSEIVERFNEFERDNISPPLTKSLLRVLLEALVDMKYIEMRDGKIYATGRQPPSRPQIGK
jgi:uncharacterized repeat protein (TIGR04076 family)